MEGALNLICSYINTKKYEYEKGKNTCVHVLINIRTYHTGMKSIYAPFYSLISSSCYTYCQMSM